MPKENINYPKAVPVLVGESGKPSEVLMQPPGPEFAIHWNATGEYIQVGVEFSISEVEKYLASVRKDSPMDGIGYLYSEELTRGDVQRTIRALKRARNAVFGAGE